MKQKSTESYREFAYRWRKEAARIRPLMSENDIEDCINLKHNIRDLVDQEVVSLQAAAPNVNTNNFQNHEGISMIETDDD